MPLSILDAGSVSRTITKCRVMDGGSLRNIIRMKVMDDDDVTLRTVATFALPLTLSANPSSIFAESYVSSTVLTEATTVTPSGGLGPYTYSWAIIAGTASATAPNNATTMFFSGTLTPNELEEATARCTCSDSSGQTATADVSLVFVFYAPV